MGHWLYLILNLKKCKIVNGQAHLHKYFLFYSYLYSKHLVQNVKQLNYVESVLKNI